MLTLIQVIDKLILVYTIMIFIRILGSWVPEWQETTFMRFISYYTDPYLNVFKRIIPPLGMIDLSPIIAIFSLQIFQEVLYRTML